MRIYFGGKGAVLASAIMLLLAIAALAGVSPARAQSVGFASGSTCFVETGTDTDYGALASQPGRWTCGEPAWSNDPERLIIRYDLRGDAELDGQPLYVRMKRLQFANLQAGVVAPDGELSVRAFTSAQLESGTQAWEGYAPLPQAGGQPVAAVLIVDQASHAKRLYDATPVDEPPFDKVAGVEHLLAAMLCGLLLAPFFFDMGFFRTLGDRFPLFHGIFCILATIQTATISGISQMIFALDATVLRGVQILSFDFLVAASAIFALSFLEDGVLGKLQRRLLAGLAVLACTLGLMVTFLPGVIGPAVVPIYYSGYLAYLVGIIYIFAYAWMRGSQAIRYIILAYAGLTIVGTGRVVSALVPGIDLGMGGIWPQNIALFFEVLVTAFAVTDRFLLLKRERDNAMIEARDMEALSERDALTGLLNRRAIEGRFAMLRASGFTALAAIDLDHFKQVNDRYGHATGDLVLQSVATTLLEADQDDTLSFRMGGEEFILLLRGRDALDRAERLRLAISANIARDIPVNEPITASMGFIDAANKALPSSDFGALYERVDRLLYEAKAAGRNRTVSERLKVFRPRKPDRRAA